jgi:alkylhydroperoxidase/carboxymuconolactone decarboxylase family protein YurZ
VGPSRPVTQDAQPAQSRDADSLEPEEFKLHVRAAFRNGVTREEIREVLLQAMIYCGVPAANSAFKQAREVFAQMEREGTAV